MGSGSFSFKPELTVTILINTSTPYPTSVSDPCGLGQEAVYSVHPTILPVITCYRQTREELHGPYARITYSNYRRLHLQDLRQVRQQG
jgi:hypothetical protein